VLSPQLTTGSVRAKACHTTDPRTNIPAAKTKELSKEPVRSDEKRRQDQPLHRLTPAMALGQGRTRHRHRDPIEIGHQGDRETQRHQRIPLPPTQPFLTLTRTVHG
jgi:hypothetical protein